MYDETIETFAFGTDDRVRVIYDIDPTNPMEDIGDNGLSLHRIGYSREPLECGADSHGADIASLMEWSRSKDDDKIAIAKHFERAGLPFLFVTFSTQGTYYGEYVVYGEVDGMDEAWLESDCETIQQYLDGEVYALVHEKREVYANVKDPEDIHEEWVYEYAVHGFIGYADMAELRYAAIESFDLPEQD